MKGKMPVGPAQLAPAAPPETLGAAVDTLRRVAAARVEADQPIAPWTSLRVGGTAAIVVEPQSEEGLEAVGAVLADHRLEPLVIGRGTNVLVSDQGFPGMVIRLGKGFGWIRGEGTEVRAGGGAPLPRVAGWAARRSLSGLEFAVAIPASVGGGVRMNAGAHDASISEVLSWASVYRLDRGVKERLTPAALEMAYRESSLGPADVVCAAAFELCAGVPGKIAAVMQSYRAHRAQTQPADAPNAGSIFRNPPGESAGHLIESAGLKGCSVGAVEVSRRHANFFLARPGATAQQVYDLMALVQRSVLEHFHIVLVPEVSIVGAFDRSAGLKERA